MKSSISGICFRVLPGIVLLLSAGRALAQDFRLADSSGFGLLGSGVGSILVVAPTGQDTAARAQADLEWLANPWGYRLGEAECDMLFLANNLPPRPMFRPVAEEADPVQLTRDTLALRKRTGVIDTFALRVSGNVAGGNDPEKELAALAVSHLPFQSRIITPWLGDGDIPARAEDRNLAGNDEPTQAPDLVLGMVASPEAPAFIGLMGALLLLRKRL